MDVEYRAITEAEFDAFARVGRVAFGAPPLSPDTPLDFARSELDRTCAAFVGDELVGTGRNYSLELTVPGGATVPVAGVSWISVLPSHRRRGVLTGMMASLRDDAAAHGEAISVLTASEGGIYGRFGYGIGTWRQRIHVDRAHSAFVSSPRDDGRIRYVDRADALERFPAVYERARRLRPGMMSRAALWWEESFHHFAPPTSACFFVLHEGADGAADGFLTYEISGDFALGINEKELRVLDFVAETPEARALLWQFVFGVDLVETVVGWLVPVDEPLRFLLADPRRFRVDAVNDHLWVQIVDISRALEARRYSTIDRIVFEVHDGPTATRVALDGGPDGVECRPSSAEPDLVLGLSQLGSIYLGGVRAEWHAAAGRVEERTPGAIARVDAMFASYPAPSCVVWD
jgi:predicted acetyltransferase